MMTRITTRIPLLLICLICSAANSANNADNWGKEIKTKAEFYASSDVSKFQVDLTRKWYEVGAKAWGNYGPLEFWIVGHDVKAAEQLDKQYCHLRKQKDPEVDTNSCENRGHNFVTYATNGNAGLNTRRGKHENWSGFIVTMSGKNPGPQEEDYLTVVLHEYFHVYQQAHVFSKDHKERDSKNQPNPWWIEGGAEYMAQLLYSRQPDVSPNHLRIKMGQKLRSITNLDEGESIRDIPYGKRGHIAYDLGAWFIAYLIHETSEEAFRVKFFKSLNKKGFEDAFIHSFGESSDVFLRKFHNEFLPLAKEDKLNILPQE